MDSIIAGLHCLHWHKILPLQWVVNGCDWITERNLRPISPIHAGLMHLFSGFTEKIQRTQKNNLFTKQISLLLS